MLLQPLRELDVVDGRVDGRERAEHVARSARRRERRVALRIEGLGLRHAAGHPQHDDRVGGGLRRRRRDAARPAAARGRPAPPASPAAVAPMKPRRLVTAARRCARLVAGRASIVGRAMTSSVRSAGTPAHQHRPQQIGQARRRDGRSPPADRRSAASASAALGRRRRAAERVPEHAIDGGVDGRERRRGAAAARPASAAAGAPGSGATSKTKKRIAGLSVEPISVRGFSRPTTPRNRVKPLAGDVVDEHRRVADADAAAACRRHRSGPVPARRPAPSTGVSDESGVAPAGPTSSASAHAGCIASGTFEPVSSTTSHSARRADDVDVEARSARRCGRRRRACSGSTGRAAARRASAARRAPASARAPRRWPAPAPAASSRRRRAST